jgi:hypothetical protein
MRFSSIFHLPLSQRLPAQAAQHALTEPVPSDFLTSDVAPLAVAAELPDDLDQRVRLIGEWQLGEG